MSGLAAYLDSAGETQASFAAKVDTTDATISRICSGTLRPGLDLAHRIEQQTDGAVPMQSWVKAA